MKVSELIEHLKTINQDLPVMFVIWEGGYYFYPITPENIRESEYESCADMKYYPACIIGEDFIA
jgi:hypothetical protein